MREAALREVSIRPALSWEPESKIPQQLIRIGQLTLTKEQAQAVAPGSSRPAADVEVETGTGQPACAGFYRPTSCCPTPSHALAQATVCNATAAISVPGCPLCSSDPCIKHEPSSAAGIPDVHSLPWAPPSLREKISARNFVQVTLSAIVVLTCAVPVQVHLLRLKVTSSTSRQSSSNA